LLYSILKDFAGPVATVIAALSAVGVTGYFVFRQWQIAKQQPQTAREKLLLDLFDKRFALYEELRACVARARAGDQIAVLEFKTAASRAQFLFGAKVITFLDATTKDLAADVVQWNSPRPDSPQHQQATSDRLVERANGLDVFPTELDALVAHYMQHHQKALGGDRDHRRFR
jgi:hypothetical protein